MDSRTVVEETIFSISAHLARATVYASCAQAIVRQDQAAPHLFGDGRPFFAVVVRSLTESAILSICHCVDKDRRGSGFPCLFRRIRKHPDLTQELEQQMAKDQKTLEESLGLSNLRQWRKQVVAHVPNEQAKQQAPLESCELTEIRSVVKELQTILNHYARPLLAERRIHVTSCGGKARGAFHKIVEMAERSAELLA